MQMKQFLFFLLYTLMFVAANGQVNYKEAIQQGDDAFNKKQYKIAINKYLMAGSFDPLKKDTVRIKVNKVYDRIEKLRIEAEEAKAATEKALEKANKLINRFYFYKDRFALAYSVIDKYGLPETRYYYIDPNGDKLEKLGDWEYAGLFNENTGFARVSSSDLNKFLHTNYLIDTSGNKYQLVYETKYLDKEIKALDISLDQWMLLPAGLLQQPQLEILFLNSINQDQPKIFTFLSEASKLFPNLWYLYMPYCKIDSLPAEIGDFKNLKTLDLTYNDLNQLPAQIGELKKLEVLSLKGNDLSYLPVEIGKLKKLKYLNLEGNTISKEEQQKIKKLLPGCKIIFKDYRRGE